MSDEIFDSNTRNELPEWKGRVSNKKVWIPGIGVIVLIIAAAVWMLFGQGNHRSNVVSNDVLLLIKGPSQLTSGNEAEYRIIYTNGEAADLTNITLELFFPSNFKFKSASPTPANSGGSRFNLNLLAAGEEAEVRIKGQLSGSTAETKQFRARLSYKLSNFNSEFALDEKFTTILTAPNLSLEIIGPIEVVGGQDTTWTVAYKNVSSQSYDNLALIASYPPGFKFSSSLPLPSKNQNYWVLPKLDSGQGGKIEVTGSFGSNTGIDQQVLAELGQAGSTFAPLINSSAVFKVVPSSLSLTLKSPAKDSVNLGQTVELEMEYGNFGSIGMTNIVITANLSGSSLDLTRVSANNAIIAGSAITWKSATLSNLSLLAPNQKGKINFSVPIKPSFSTNIKNQTIKASASIYSAEVPKPISVPDLELKLASELSLSVSGQYVSGALPMTVGQKTTFALTFLTTNLANDLDSVEVIASIPLPASSWANVVVPQSEKDKVTFDPTSGKVRWKIGRLAAFSGKFTPALTATFHLTVEPAQTDRGKVVQLAKNIQALGFDAFINKEISSIQVLDVDTGSIDDDAVNLKGTTVQ